MSCRADESVLAHRIVEPSRSQQAQATESFKNELEGRSKTSLERSLLSFLHHLGGRSRFSRNDGHDAAKHNLGDISGAIASENTSQGAREAAAEEQPITLHACTDNI